VSEEDFVLPRSLYKYCVLCNVEDFALQSIFHADISKVFLAIPVQSYTEL
jgi:hypothetical protein